MSILLYIVDVQRCGFSLIDQQCRSYGGVNLAEFEIFLDIYSALCPLRFDMKPSSYGFETSHSESIYIADVQRRGFSSIDRKLSKLRGCKLRRI